MNTEIEQTETAAFEEIETIQATKDLHPVIAFGKAHGLKIMTVGFIIFGLSVFLNLYTRSAMWTSVLAGIGFVIYLTGRILHAVSKKHIAR